MPHAVTIKDDEPEGQARLEEVKYRLWKNLRCIGETRVCHRSKTEQWIRYMSTEPFGASGMSLSHSSTQEQLSSTRIHYILFDFNNDEELIDFLPGVALSPEMLCGYIRRYKEIEVADPKPWGRMF